MLPISILNQLNGRCDLAVTCCHGASSIGTTVFASPTCALKALQVLQRTGADPCKLKMEPTKSVAVDDMEGMTA